MEKWEKNDEKRTFYFEFDEFQFSFLPNFSSQFVFNMCPIIYLYLCLYCNTK